jgi:hypothetical protein
MDHNDFEFDDDFIEPLLEFIKQTNIHFEELSGDTGLSFSDDYYFPPNPVI